MAETTVEQMNEALKRYYTFMGKGEEYDKGSFKFEDFCEENGLEDDALKDELEAQEEDGDSLFAQYYDDNENVFPVQDAGLDVQDRREKAIQIIIKCFKDPNCSWDVAELPKC